MAASSKIRVRSFIDDGIVHGFGGSSCKRHVGASLFAVDFGKSARRLFKKSMRSCGVIGESRALVRSRSRRDISTASKLFFFFVEIFINQL